LKKRRKKEKIDRRSLRVYVPLIIKRKQLFDTTTMEGRFDFILRSALEYTRICRARTGKEKLITVTWEGKGNLKGREGKEFKKKKDGNKKDSQKKLPLRKRNQRLVFKK
jgi:hypothetical protein